MKTPRYYVDKLCYNLDCIIDACTCRDGTADAALFIRAMAGSYACINMLRELLPMDEEAEE